MSERRGPGCAGCLPFGGSAGGRTYARPRRRIQVREVSEVQSKGLAVCLCAALVAGVQAANEMGMGVIADSEGFRGEVWGEVAGITDARMQKEGSADWIVFDVLWGTDFMGESDVYPSLEAFNGDIAGDYILQITHSGGVSTYEFTITPALAEWFPPIPVLSPVPPVIPQQYLFEWTWSGLADAKIIEYYCWDGGYEFDNEGFWWAGDPGFDDLSYLADFDGHCGEGLFVLEYGNLADGLVTNWRHTGGQDIFGGSEAFSYVTAEDRAEFEVVPEPSSLGLVALGGLWVWWRRRTA